MLSIPIGDNESQDHNLTDLPALIEHPCPSLNIQLQVHWQTTKLWSELSHRRISRFLGGEEHAKDWLQAYTIGEGPP